MLPTRVTSYDIDQLIITYASLSQQLSATNTYQVHMYDIDNTELEEVMNDKYTVVHNESYARLLLLLLFCPH